MKKWLARALRRIAERLDPEKDVLELWKNINPEGWKKLWR